MILAVDIGNTNIVSAVVNDEGKVVFSVRRLTDKLLNTHDASEMFCGMRGEIGSDLDNVEGVIISSVVPEVTQIVRKAAEDCLNAGTIVLGKELDCGIKIEREHEHLIGADLIAAACGAALKYDGALALFDFGTATTLSVITSDKVFKGGLIIPGIEISKEAMIKKASQLPDFSLKQPKRFIGLNTVECMRSGIINGNAAMTDALIDRVEAELNQKVKAVATGGLSKMICANCRHTIFYEPDLIFEGLWHIYRLNN